MSVYARVRRAADALALTEHELFRTAYREQFQQENPQATRDAWQMYNGRATLVDWMIRWLNLWEFSQERVAPNL